MTEYHGAPDKLKYHYDHKTLKKKLEAVSSDTLLSTEVYTKAELANYIKENKIELPFIALALKTNEDFLISSKLDIKKLSAGFLYSVHSHEIKNYKLNTKAISYGNSKIILTNNNWFFPFNKKLLNQATEPLAVSILKKDKEFAFIVSDKIKSNITINSFTRNEKRDFIYFAFLWIIQSAGIANVKELYNTVRSDGKKISIQTYSNHPAVLAENYVKIHITNNYLKYKAPLYQKIINYIYEYFKNTTSLEKFPVLKSEQMGNINPTLACDIKSIEKINLIAAPLELNSELITYLSLDPKTLYFEIYNKFTKEQIELFRSKIELFNMNNYVITNNIYYEKMKIRFLALGEQSSKIRFQAERTQKNKVEYLGKIIYEENALGKQVEHDISLELSSGLEAKINACNHTEKSNVTSAKYIPIYLNKEEKICTVENNIEICSLEQLKLLIEGLY